MLQIENNFFTDSCVMCKSNLISKIGNLRYSGKYQFSTHKIFLKRIPEIWQCKDCLSFFTQNCITANQAEELYTSGNGTKRWSSVEFTLDKTNEVQSLLNKYLSNSNQRVLDIGCNTGEFLDYAQRKGLKTYGLELCKESCDLISKKGHKAFRLPIDIDEKFELVTAFDVVEHLYNPNDFFLSMRNIIKPNGYLIVLTGNPLSFHAKKVINNWWYFNYPEHVFFPSPKVFESLDGFNLVGYVSTYASKSHQKGNRMLKMLNQSFKKITSINNGLPAYVPDHQFIVLQRV